MYENILVSLSLDHGFGVRAIEVAKTLTSEGGSITAVHVFEPINSTVSLYVPAEHMQNVRKSAKEEIAKRIGEQGDVKTVLLTDHSSGRAITKYAEEIGADCIIVGSHKSEVQDYFLGSTTSRIVRHAHCAVHVLR